MNRAPLYAHTPDEQGNWHPLDHHLYQVAQEAAAFASVFGAEDLAFLAGLLHDLGKANPEFQHYLLAQREGNPHHIVPHAHWGAAIIYELFCSQKMPWEDIVLPVAGHHAGLEEPGIISARLVEYLEQHCSLASDLKQLLLGFLKRFSVQPKLKFVSLDPLKREFRIRMLFSALVDADYLDTEKHFAPQKVRVRYSWPDLKQLWVRFQADQEQLLKSVNTAGVVNRVRREVYEACLRAATGKQGIYRLTVPTGGGKTRSSLAFALRHALTHNLRRIIVALPYTSIIDQTVQVYQDILGKDAVLEHHSQAAYFQEDHTEKEDKQFLRLCLATENWDAPLIVTTTVQLFESLFGHRPSKCRKLHNLAGSVIILDEVQTLPPELLAPTVDVLRTLVEDYRVTVVLSTATQPALDNTPYLKEFQGTEVQEIVPHYPQLFQSLRRVEYEFWKEPLPAAALAEQIRAHPQVLVILNTRKEAVQLFDQLADRDDAYHLSTLLCGAHRREVLGEVRQRLFEGRPVCLVSTQVVEAGVDLDFPVVYRVIGPLDRIVQAAGRCNREGKQKRGRVVLFELEGGRSPRGPYKAGLEKARLLLQKYPSEALHEPWLYEEYFQRLFGDLDLDRNEVQAYRKVLNYPEVAKRYKLIRDNTLPVVVPYRNALSLLDRWSRFPSRGSWRQLQPYLVNLYEHDLKRFERDGWAEKVTEGLYVWRGGYDRQKGVVEAYHDPSDLVI